MMKIDNKKMDDNGLRFSCGNVFPHWGEWLFLLQNMFYFLFTVESRILCWAVFFVWLLKFVL